MTGPIVVARSNHCVRRTGIRSMPTRGVAAIRRSRPRTTPRSSSPASWSTITSIAPIRREGVGSFLLSSFKFYLCDEVGRSRAQRRGGGVTPLPFEISSGEEMYACEPSHDETPERIYERRWARTLLDCVVNKLRDEFIVHGRLEHFNKLKGCLQGSVDVPYAELARQLEMTESALKVGIHRLRKRYRDLLRAEIAEIVADPADIDAELRYLIAVLAGKSS